MSFNFKRHIYTSVISWWRATSTTSSKSSIYKKENKTSSSPIMWNRYAKRTIGWLCASPAGARKHKVNYRGIEGEHCAQCARVRREEIERETRACKASKLGPVERWCTQDGKLGITIQDPPLESGRWTHLLHFTYSYCILSRVWKLITLLPVLRYYEHLFCFLC